MIVADFGSIIEPLARLLFGEPNRAMSSKNELRYGSRGSLSIDLEKGTWFDHETSIGGGTLDLITREKGLHGADRLQWMRDNGLDIDNGQSRPTNGQHGPKLGPIIEAYDYTDETGDLLFQVTRHDPKDFRQRRPDRSQPDGWKWGVKGVRQVPYRLPDLQEHLTEHTIFIVEGEKDVNRLWRLNVPATTNAGGAGKWRAELCEFFKGADVVVIPDYDPQKKNPKTGELMFHDDGRPILPGQDHAQDVAAQLHAVAQRVRVLELWKYWPAMPLKGDVSSWLDAGHTIEDLNALVDKTPNWPTEQTPSSQPILTIPDWLARELPEPDRLSGHWFSTTSRVIASAPTGLGKTMIGMRLGLAMAAGVDFLHWRGVRPCNVLMIDGEMSRRLIKARLEKEIDRSGLKPNGFHLLNHEDVENFGPLNTKEGRAIIEAQIARIGRVDAIIFDNVMSLITGDMKDEESWRQTLPWIKSLTRRRIGQLWLHHTGHDESRGYGTKTREWQMDAVIQLDKIEHPETDVAFVLRFTKAREREPATRNDFADMTITLIRDAWSAKPATREPSGKKLSPQAKSFFEALCDTINSGEDKVDGRPATQVETWRIYCAKRGLMDAGNGNSARATFSKNRRLLIEAKKIVVNDPMVWLVDQSFAMQTNMGF